jgi:hypothetical protein
LRTVFAKFAHQKEKIPIAIVHPTRSASLDGVAMDSTLFRKMMKTCKLLDKDLFPLSACDELHTRHKSEHSKAITFSQFVEKALPEIAAKHGKGVDEITALIIANCE